MNQCIVVIYKKGLSDSVAKVLADAYEGTFTDVVLIDEAEICAGGSLRSYIFANRKFPSTCGMHISKFYRKYKIKEKDKLEYKESKFTLVNNVREAMRRSENVLYRFFPKAVICLTARALALMSEAKKTTGYRGVIISGIYDYMPSSGMADKRCDRYFVATNECADKLMSRGVAAESVKVTGMPVRYELKDRSKSLKELSIRSDKPVVLVAGGRYGCGYAGAAAKALYAFSDRLHVILVAGGNKSYERMVGKYPQMTVVTGGNDDMARLYAAADVAVTSPTSFITAECAYSHMPVVLLKPSNKVEKANFGYLVKGGFCLDGSNVHDMISWVMDLLLDRGKYRKYSSKAEELTFFDGVAGLKEAIDGILEELRYVAVMDGEELPEKKEEEAAPQDKEEDDSASDDVPQLLKEEENTAADSASDNVEEEQESAEEEEKSVKTVEETQSGREDGKKKRRKFFFGKRK